MGQSWCSFDFTARRFPKLPPWHDGIRGVERDVVAFAQSVGIPCRITSRCRSWAEQNALYCQRRGTRFPAARPGTSQHEWGMAFDIVPDRNALRRYNASFADGLVWLVAVARYYGADAIPEGDHTHVQWFTSEDWQRSRFWIAMTSEGEVDTTLQYPPTCGEPRDAPGT